MASVCVSSDCARSLLVHNEGVFFRLQAQGVVVHLHASMSFSGLRAIVEPGLSIEDRAVEESWKGYPRLTAIAGAQGVGSFCVFLDDFLVHAGSHLFLSGFA